MCDNNELKDSILSLERDTGYVQVLGYLRHWKLSSDCLVWSIGVMRKIISQRNSTTFFSCDAVSLFVVAVDSPVSKVTGGWMDKTKDQINSFSPSLIARWEPKLFFFFFLFKLQALTKLLIYLWPLENGIPAHLALWN